MKDEKTPDEIAKATEEKRKKEDIERFAKMQKQINDLIEIVTLQHEVSTGSPDDLDSSINHICDRCPAVSMGNFTNNPPEFQERFEDIKDKYPPKKGSRPMKSLTQVRDLFLDSIVCSVDVCPYSYGINDKYIGEYVKLRRDIEGRTRIWMAKHKIVQFPPMMGKN